MTAGREELLALAERCEQATGADRQLDAEIIRAIGGKLKSSDWWIGFAYIGRAVPAYTASLDSAMTLIPEGWTFANLSQGDGKSWWSELRRGYLTSYDKVAIGRQVNVAGPALAICAAALRARAATPAQGEEASHPPRVGV